MTRHLIRLMWNRRGRNALVMAEIFFAFLVLFAVSLLGLSYLNNWRQPLGYSYANVWSVTIGTGASEDPQATGETPEAFRQLLAALRGLPEVQAAAAVSMAPYSTFDWGSSNRIGRRPIQYAVNSATDEFRDVIDLQVVGGRWFSSEDDADPDYPVVINRQLAREIFGDEDAVGRVFRDDREVGDDGTPYRRMHVVGVVADYRKNGELEAPRNTLFYRLRKETFLPSLVNQRDGPTGSSPSALVIRVSPETTAAFEEELLATLQGAARSWSFQIQPIADMRAERIDQVRALMVVFGTLGGFLLMMVALGLTGVLWQNVTERRQEFGIRRAKGASSHAVGRQIVIELAIVTSVALIPALILVAQLQILPFADPDLAISPTVFGASVLASIAVIYLLTIACGWYPSRLAARLQPAEALHYE